MPDKITKFLQNLDAKTQEHIKFKLSQLRENPFSMPNVKKIQSGNGDFYRLRIGKIRIIYTLTDMGVIVVDIDYRGNIY